ncbi:MpaA1 family daptide-type RiPP [uncultured Microbacterium sp.]|nr:MpaA1 family daptide-type RiPP [uncultured Microbacterium sp.]
MTETVEMRVEFQELDEMDAPSWESFYKGVIGALILVGAAAAT